MRTRVGGTLALAGGLLCAARALGFPAPEGDTQPVLPAVHMAERPGAALRAADAAVAAGELATAEALLRRLAWRHPVVADYAELALLELLAETERTEEALARGEAWAYPDSPLRADVHRQVGDAWAARGEQSAARSAYQRALEATDDPERQAALAFAIGLSFVHSGLDERAAEVLTDVWAQYPLVELPALDEALAGLEQRLGRRLRDAARLRERADVFFRERHNERALAGYEEALSRGLDGADARRARRQRAHTLFRMRRYTEAAAAFAALPATAENRTAGARARARAGEVREAAAELERIARDARGDARAYARLVAALLWDGEGEAARARELFQSLARSSNRRARDARWWLGWDAYRDGRDEEALEHLSRLAELEQGIEAQLRARYWRARAAERAGRRDAAKQFAAMAREFPFTYYGWRAGQRVSGPVAREPGEPLEAQPDVLAPSQLERPRALLEAGRVEAALAELHALYTKARGLDDRLALAELYANAADFNRAQRIVASAYGEALARGPGGEALELWWHAWPAPYDEAVRDQTAPRPGLDPGLVYAIMREESGYRPAVRSVSGALGLMQLMPDTALRVAQRDAFAGFRVDDLFTPATNIRVGAAYLHELLEIFDGNLAAAIGSYNAGPHRVERWLAEGPRDDAEWVEAIPYEQTRTYVKRVLRSMHAYRVLY